MPFLECVRPGSLGLSALEAGIAMRPMFADTMVAETGIELVRTDPGLAVSHSLPADRASAYREWRRSRVLFMHAESEAERAVVPGVADLPAQRSEGRP